MKKACKKHWQKLGIKTPDDLKKYIESCFERNHHQQNVIVDLYKLAFPNWDELTKADGYPQIGLDFWTFIHHRFLDFDRMFHPDVMAAGAWTNWGFSCNRKLKDWEISFENCSIKSK
jgi:hypothetical protein